MQIDTTDPCHQHNSDCTSCTSQGHVEGHDCVWCPGSPGDQYNKGRCVSRSEGACGTHEGAFWLGNEFIPGSGDNGLYCKSSCTESTCPNHAACYDDPDSADPLHPEAMCMCNDGFYAPAANGLHDIATTCLPMPQVGGEVAHLCIDHGHPTDMDNCGDSIENPSCLYSQAYNAEAQCGRRRRDCTSTVEVTRQLMSTWCPKTCGACHGAQALVARVHATVSLFASRPVAVSDFEMATLVSVSVCKFRDEEHRLQRFLDD